MADWIGSDISRFPFFFQAGRRRIAWDEYADDARVRAQKALTEMLWLKSPQAAAGDVWSRVLGEGWQPRPLQRQLWEVANGFATPGIAIVEAPTGEGKTEAAFAFADRCMTTFDVRGLYVALPTMATSNQMYGRVRTLLERSHPGDETVLLQLLHGLSSLNDDFSSRLRRASDEPRAVGSEVGESDADHGGADEEEAVLPHGVYGDEDHASIVAGEWFTKRKRGLLAPFGVGTIDQALLAVLRVRHVFVRLFGLAGKTVIIDEVHAYDTYMSTLLERLLGWLGALRCNVVLLSATLPRHRVRELLEAYQAGCGDANADAPLDVATYPRVTWATGATSGSGSIDQTTAGGRTFAIRWRDGPSPHEPAGASALAEWLREELREGGCAVIICNTVRRAQDLYRCVAPAFASPASDRAPTVELLHSRLLLGQRSIVEGRILRRYGPSDENRRPHRAILIATQVVEQSLDLDFDLMVSDFAPIDLLLQRAGRMHRHQRSRPGPLAQPELHVIAPSVDDGVPAFAPADQAVYDRHVLLRTWLTLRTHGDTIRGARRY